MDIIFYHPTFDTQWWIEALRKAIPQARIRVRRSGDNNSADYALARHPPVEMPAGCDLKAVLALGAGVDSILSKLQVHPEMLKPSVLSLRLGDTGIGEQMQEYTASQALHWFRRSDDYRTQQNSLCWQPLPKYHREDLIIGVLGAGVLSSKVAQSLQTRRFPLRCWSRTRKSWSGLRSFAGREELSAFLGQCQALINLLPNTPGIAGTINQQLLEKLPDGTYLLNLACGVHVVEDDLLAVLDSNKVKGVMLDVFNRELLPPESPLWQHPRVMITPHVVVITRPTEAVDYISCTITQLEKGERVCGQVDRACGH